MIRTFVNGKLHRLRVAGLTDTSVFQLQRY